VLSYDVNKSTAQKLLWLSNQISPLYNYKMERFLKPILIETSGVKRIYPYKDLLTPVIGHTIKREKNQLTIPQGVMGIERIAQHSAQKIKTTINLKKQKELERKVDDIKDEYSAKEVLGITIDLKSGAIKALASSLRYDPNNITKKDIDKLPTHINQYLFSSDTLLFPLIRTIEIFENKEIDQITHTKISKYFNRFKLFDKSSELPHERQMNIAKFLARDTFHLKDTKLNFLQTIKLYTIFFNQGKSVQPKILKNSLQKSVQVIKSDIATTVFYETKKILENPQNRDVVLNFDDKNISATLLFNPVDNNELTVFLTVHKDKVGVAEYQNIEIKPVVYFKEYEETNEELCPAGAASSDIQVFIRYPKIIGIEDELSNKINNILKNYSGINDLEPQTTFEIDYTIMFLNEHFLSILYRGSAMHCQDNHPVTWYRTLNISLKNGKPLKLNEIFKKRYLKKLSEKVLNALNKKYNGYFYNIDTNDLDLNKFTIDERFVYFYFDMYEIAAGYMDRLFVKIPYEISDLSINS
jgi:hypothetical protein